MTTPVGQLLVRIAADTGSLVRGGLQSERSLNRVGKSAAATTKRVAALGAAAAAAATVAMAAFAKQAIKTADEIAKTARTIGITSEGLQELRFAAGRAGIEMKAFDGALMAFSKRVGEARSGTGAAGEDGEVPGGGGAGRSGGGNLTGAGGDGRCIVTVF